MNNFYYSVFYRALNRAEYRKYLLLFISIQVVISFLWKDYDKTIDVVLVIFNVILSIILYILSARRYRDIWQSNPWLAALLILIPFVWFFAFFELCMKNWNKISNDILKSNSIIDLNENKEKINYKNSKKINIYLKLFYISIVIIVTWILLFWI